MKLKDEVFWKVFLRPPYNPADTDIGETKLVTRGVDGDDAGNPEVPEKLCVSKWRNECTRRSIDCVATSVKGNYDTAGNRTMDRDRVTTLSLVFVEEVCHLFDWLIVTSVGTSKNDIYTDSIFVHKLHSFLGIQPVFALSADWDKSTLDFKVASKFFEGNLGIGAHNNVGTRFINGFASGLATFLPNAFHGKTTELNSFRGASSGGTDRFFTRRCMPKIGKDGDASGVDEL